MDLNWLNFMYFKLTEFWVWLRVRMASYSPKIEVENRYVIAFSLQL